MRFIDETNRASFATADRDAPKAEMGKKGVPEWMNSSLWSSSAPSATAATSGDVDRITRPSPNSDTSPRQRSPPPPPLQHPSLTFVTESLSPPIPPPNASKPEIGGDTGAGDDPLSSSISAAEISRFSAEEISRQSQLLSELSKKVIDLDELRRLAAQGIPDGAGIRPTVWKLLLGYLPNDRILWREELDKKRNQYQAFKEEFLVNPSEITRRLDESTSSRHELNSEGSEALHRLELTDDEHPLSLGKTSMWNKFFQDSEVIEQIERDVMRTHPDMHFFSGDSAVAKSNQESLRNVLIIFAKLNPGIRYVQGMNEVLAPLFYVYRNDQDANNAVFAEPDAFFCFIELLSGFRDNFCQKLDNSVVGIRSTISRFSQLLKKHDGELWRHLEITTKVNPQFYAFRWITLLLTQEFNFADALHIWDVLLSDAEGPQETLLRICCAMLILVRRRLLAGDFTSNLKLLQNYPATNISHLLYVANKLREV
ncbi:hypothetical protein AXF42_Ash002859 [Apostasia shenzhenica]|uniref:Rab-GAP TBC domain-containing protein n=1 Tax=Apostasia shenzhenica TaxID=1088818 RepID=A0A2I0A7I7_9ASPA|nr:hypothetical protein AXF42_Ash002859 [Apostasia shenzhenica]